LERKEKKRKKGKKDKGHHKHILNSFSSVTDLWAFHFLKFTDSKCILKTDLK